MRLVPRRCACVTILSTETLMHAIDLQWIWYEWDQNSVLTAVIPCIKKISWTQNSSPSSIYQVPYVKIHELWFHELCSNLLAFGSPVLVRNRPWQDCSIPSTASSGVSRCLAQYTSSIWSTGISYLFVKKKLRLIYCTCYRMTQGDLLILWKPILVIVICYVYSIKWMRMLFANRLKNLIVVCAFTIIYLELVT